MASVAKAIRKVNTNTWLDRSTDFSKKFAIMDTMTNQIAEWLTFDEIDLILKQMEIRTKSKLEGNWTTSDCAQFLAETLGEERYAMIKNLWVLQNQEMISQHNTPEALREIWINKISMREVTPEEALRDPSMYTTLKVPK
jgi:hypothetical protein